MDLLIAEKGRGQAFQGARKPDGPILEFGQDHELGCGVPDRKFYFPS